MKSKHKITPPKRITSNWLRKIGVKEMLIPGILFAVTVLGIKNWDKLGFDIKTNKTVFPESGVVRIITDGDTFELQNGARIRLVGINAPDRGEKNEQAATDKLSSLVKDKKVWLEYDRYLDDQNGRALAWVWIDCEGRPDFKESNYMRLTYNRSRPGLISNPENCTKGFLVQEELIDANLAVVEVYKDRGELKYQKRISQ